MSDNPAVEVAKERRADEEQAGVVVLSTGYRARLHPVGALLIDDVRAKVKVPDVPKWKNPDNEREEENPNDPQYKRDLDKYNNELGNAVVDALLLFGVELIDPLPTDGLWIKKLEHLKIPVNTDDPILLDLIFKRRVALGQQDFLRLVEASGVSGAAIDNAARSFQR